MFLEERNPTAKYRKHVQEEDKDWELTAGFSNIRSLVILTRAVLENDGYESLIGVSSRDKVEKKKTEIVKTTLLRNFAVERSRETEQ